METIDIEVRIDRKMDVTVHIADVIEGIAHEGIKAKMLELLNEKIR